MADLLVFLIYNVKKQIIKTYDRYDLELSYLFFWLELGAQLVACVAGGFKGLGVYGEGNYGERNEKAVYNIIRRRREKLGTRREEPAFFSSPAASLIFPACAVLYYIRLSHCARHNFPRHNPQPFKTAGYAGYSVGSSELYIDWTVTPDKG